MSASTLQCPKCGTFECCVNLAPHKFKYSCINGHNFNKNKAKKKEVSK